jgi:hypothetical protein
MRRAYKIFDGKIKRYWYRQVDIIKTDLKKTGWEDVDWIQVAQTGAVCGLPQTSNKPSSFIKGGEIFD